MVMMMSHHIHNYYTFDKYDLDFRTQEMGRQDDLWSLFYMLVEFITGALPWRKMKEKEQVGSLKDKYDHSLFLKHLPTEFRAFLNHLQGLDYNDTPHYAALQGLIQQCMHRKGILETDPFDWEKVSTEMSVSSITVTTQAAIKECDVLGLVRFFLVIFLS